MKQLLRLFSDKKLITQHYGQGLSIVEIAKLRGITRQAVYKQLKRQLEIASKKGHVQINNFANTVRKTGGASELKISRLLRVPVKQVRLLCDLSGCVYYKKCVFWRTTDLYDAAQALEVMLRTIPPVKDPIKISGLWHEAQLSLCSSIVLVKGKWTSKHNKQLFPSAKSDQLVAELRLANRPMHFTEFSTPVSPGYANNILQKSPHCRLIGSGMYEYSELPVESHTAKDIVIDFLGEPQTMPDIVDHVKSQMMIKKETIKQYVYRIARKGDDNLFRLRTTSDMH